MEIKKEYFENLGMKAEDKVTGFKGVITSLSFDLQGCIMYLLTPQIQKKGDKYSSGDSHWFDVSRIKIEPREKRVMDAPDFNFVRAPYVLDKAKNSKKGRQKSERERPRGPTDKPGYFSSPVP